MNLAYRIYLGARNTQSRVFSPQDVEIVEAILNEHFQGWTTAKAAGSWLGKTEETLVITVTSRGIRAGDSSALDAIEACATRLKEYLGQESVMIEEGGAARFF